MNGTGWSTFGLRRSVGVSKKMCIYCLRGGMERCGVHLVSENLLVSLKKCVYIVLGEEWNGVEYIWSQKICWCQRNDHGKHEDDLTKDLFHFRFQ